MSNSNVTAGDLEMSVVERAIAGIHLGRKIGIDDTLSLDELERVVDEISEEAQGLDQQATAAVEIGGDTLSRIQKEYLEVKELEGRFRALFEAATHTFSGDTTTP